MCNHTHQKLYLNKFSRLYTYTKRTKYRDFQYRLLLRKIVTNVDLYQRGIIKSQDCSFCDREPETLQHLFCGCEKIQSILNSLFMEHGDENNIELNWSVESILFSHIHDTDSHVFNLLCTFMKCD